MQSSQSCDGAVRSLAKSARGVSLYSRLINRPLGKVLAHLAHRVGISANSVTTISAIVTYSAIALIALLRPSALLGVTIAGLLVLGFALDSADGQVARMAGTSSLAGEWYDHVVDAGKVVALHAAVLINWYRFDIHDGAWLLLAIAFQFVAVVTFSGLTTVGLLKRLNPSAVPSNPPSLARAIGLLPADYGILCCAFVVWGAKDVFAALYLILFILNAAILVGFLARWFSELIAIDRVAASDRLTSRTVDKE